MKGVPAQLECLLPGREEHLQGTRDGAGGALSCPLCFPVEGKQRLFFLLAYKWVNNGFPPPPGRLLSSPVSLSKVTKVL